MSVTLPLEPRQLATWLQVAKAQRERAHAKACSDYGADTPAAMQIASEAAEIGIQIGYLLKEAAKAPHTMNAAGKTTK